MKKQSGMITPDQVIEIILRRRWYLIIPFCLALVVGMYLVVALPKIYSASTLILIQPQKVPDEYVRSVVSSDINTRLNTISQQILSRSNLERIITQFNLFSEPEQANMFDEDKIASLRKRISVDLIRSERRGPVDAFSISFKGEDPQLVMRVTNALSNYFIDENLKVREAQALGTSDFLDDELEQVRQKLEQHEEALKNYRARFMGGLPEQLQTNLRILEGLQVQLNMKNESLRYAKNNLLLLDKQLEVMRPPVEPSDSSAAETEAPSISEDEKRLKQLEDQLALLKLNYTDKHPDIIRLKKTLEELKTQIANSPAEELKPALDPISGRSAEAKDERTMRLMEREELKIQIDSLEAEIQKIEGQIQHYQRMVEDTPKREQELLSLNRNYQNIKELYDSLLARKLESDISVSMEKKQKGEQFRILDAAKVPEKPSEPDMQKLFIMIIGAGLGLGAGIIFLLEYLDTSLRKPEEIEEMIGLPVLCTVPRLIHPKDRLKKRLNVVFSLFFVGVSLVLFAGFTVLTFKGVDKTLDFVRRFVNI